MESTVSFKDKWSLRVMRCRIVGGYIEHASKCFKTLQMKEPSNGQLQFDFFQF